MTNRERSLITFLDASGWGEAKRTPLAGDASNRRYERLDLEGKPAVLMDAPPEKGEDVRPFIKVAEYLNTIGLSAPAILSADKENGFLLLEDLGDALFARVITQTPELEVELYEAATDVLLVLHAAAPPADLAVYDAKIMAELAALAHKWYAGSVAGGFTSTFEKLLAEHISDYSVLIQRDYHAENLLWIPQRDGVARVGLLDFQDAMLGHPAYDLVSVLQDARRDVPKHIEAAMVARYIKASSFDPDSFKRVYALLGVQRNLRILGVFGRLSLHNSKPHYIDFIPRVWGYLLRSLEHPALASLRDDILIDLPAPNAAHLKHLKDLCGTVPTLS